MLRQCLAVMLLAAMLGGCAPQNVITMSELKAPEKPFVEDRTQPDSYPGMAAGEGNIYSCRYGIHLQTVEEFSPQKAQMFAGLLAKNLPGVAQQKVVLHRFDVYNNTRLGLLRSASQSIGGQYGWVGAGIAKAIADSDKVNADVYTFDRLVFDQRPDATRHPSEKMVGCDNAREGEYYASEITGGHSVVVTWLKFDVDGKPYHFRTFYQYQPASKPDVLNGIKEAIEMSFKAAADRVKVK